MAVLPFANAAAGFWESPEYAESDFSSQQLLPCVPPGSTDNISDMTPGLQDDQASYIYSLKGEREYRASSPFCRCSVSRKRLMSSESGILFGTMSCRKIAAGHSDTAVAAQHHTLVDISV